jgi:hypothetical protein
LWYKELRDSSNTMPLILLCKCHRIIFRLGMHKIHAIVFVAWFLWRFVTRWYIWSYVRLRPGEHASTIIALLSRAGGSGISRLARRKNRYVRSIRVKRRIQNDAHATRVDGILRNGFRVNARSHRFLKTESLRNDDRSIL